MDATLNGGDPRTYKKVQDNDEFNANVSPANDAGSSNSETQQTNSSTSYSMVNESGTANQSSNDHGKTS